MTQTEWDYNDREVLVKHPGEDWRVAVPSEIYCTLIAKRDDTALLQQALEAIESLEKDVDGSLRPLEQAAKDALRERLK